MLSFPDMGRVRGLKGHTASVLSVALDRQQRWVATGGQDAVACLWDTQVGRGPPWRCRDSGQGAGRLARACNSRGAPRSCCSGADSGLSPSAERGPPLQQRCASRLAHARRCGGHAACVNRAPCRRPLPHRVPARPRPRPSGLDLPAHVHRHGPPHPLALLLARLSLPGHRGGTAGAGRGERGDGAQPGPARAECHVSPHPGRAGWEWGGVGSGRRPGVAAWRDRWACRAHASLAGVCRGRL